MIREFFPYLVSITKSSLMPVMLYFHLSLPYFVLISMNGELPEFNSFGSLDARRKCEQARREVQQQDWRS